VPKQPYLYQNIDLMSQFPISSLLTESRVCCGATITSKKKSLQQIAALLESGTGMDADETEVDMDVMDALAAREKLGCTGMGNGIAIPHGRVPFVEHPVAALITLDQPVDFDAPDNIPVDIVFGLLMPEDKTDAHLEILATLAKFFNEPHNRQAVRETTNVKDLMSVISRADLPKTGADG
jgi:PTS system nitrogen regulatory IIA component